MFFSALLLNDAVSESMRTLCVHSALAPSSLPLIRTHG